MHIYKPVSFAAGHPPHAIAGDAGDHAVEEHHTVLRTAADAVVVHIDLVADHKGLDFRTDFRIRTGEVGRHTDLVAEGALHIVDLGEGEHCHSAAEPHTAAAVVRHTEGAGPSRTEEILGMDDAAGDMEYH